MATKKYNFRIRFNVTSRVHIETDQTKLFLLKEPGAYDVYLKTERGKTFLTASKLSLFGGPFATKEAARIEGKKWREIAEIAFACTGLAADFGDRASKSSFTKAGLADAAKQHGQRVLDDIHGLDVYDISPAPLFISMNMHLKIGIPADILIDVVQDTLKKNVSNNDAERLAYDLYSASFDLKFPDARFLTLMMAVETLAERKNRPEESVTIIETLRKVVKDSGINERQRDSILSSLKDLKLQSIGDACKELVKPLEEIRYSNLPPDKFITECYRLRSKLVHGSNPRPSREDVDALAAVLEILVSHLLSHKLAGPYRDTGVTKKNKEIALGTKAL
jgi:hypothetical protein